MEAAGFAMSKFKERGQFPEGFRIKISRNRQNVRKVFIGGLSLDISKQAVLEYVSQFGEVLDFEIKTHPDTGLSRGFGFVLFKDCASVEKVLQMKEHELGGKKIEFKRATAVPSPSRPTKVFVGGLNPLMPEEKVREYFDLFGEIENIEFPLFPGTKKRRAFCFITYADTNSVRKLVQDRFHVIGSRWCEVKVALPKQYSKSQSQLVEDVPSAGIGYPGAGRVLKAKLTTDHGASQNAFGANQNVFSANQNVFSANQNVFSANQNVFSANQNVFSANQNVFGETGGSRGLPTMFTSYPFVSPTEEYNFSPQMYANPQDDYSNQQVFQHCDGNNPLRYNYETYAFNPACTYYNAQINPAFPFGSGYQGI
ncbi:heterogeneous nuclear ribonucleoprotein D-like [Fukomys damarensis]|uniref:Heterogeneous nuclear ribonucleoprotein D-like n=1 Tax=Fukomys damarensis TaxID=885580 RepID=A0A091DVG2_FUKDA|nr:heterogeneous nuclear ribonucleoprotein D-like [Fukomys damarensis]KFO34478.1 Heterogeneous nuclear ribonucleoprotein D-like [Fukomys damarensis]